MVVFGQIGCMLARWLELGKNGCLRAKGFHSGKLVVFGLKYLYLGKNGCTRAKVVKLGKVVVISQKLLYSGKWLHSGKSCCIPAKW